MKKDYVKPTVQKEVGKEGAGEIAQASGFIAIIVIAIALNLVVTPP